MDKTDTSSSVAGETDEEEYEVEYRVKPVVMSQPIALNHRSMPPAAEDIVAHFDEYGTTPPRTRIKNKSREWDRRQKVIDGSAKKNADGSVILSTGLARMNRSRVNRRNTMDCAILNEMFVGDESANKAISDKRSKQLLRESERDMKRATMASLGTSTGGIGSVVEAANHQMLQDERESFTAAMLSNNNYIYCNNKYKSVACRTSAPPTTFPPHLLNAPPTSDPALCVYDRSKLQVRRDFHETFANLIKLGSDKQDNKPSSEIETWQLELNDMIWLELQAWHAERTLEEQDKFLCAARNDVPKLLDKILHYRFKPTYSREASVVSNDSGNYSASECKESPDHYNPMARFTALDLSNMDPTGGDESPPTDPEDKCKDCISMYCKHCQTQQLTALREVEELLTRLEDAENLYPSSRVMGSYHPIYKSVGFVGRVKAMCLWYNITKYQRLKLTLIGFMFRRLQGKSFQWPTTEPTYDPNYGSASSSSAQENDDSGLDSVDSRKPPLPRCIPKVKFTFDGDEKECSPSPPDSANSSDSMKGPPQFPTNFSDYNRSPFAKFINDVQTYPVDLLDRNAAVIRAADPSVSPYRQYIEHIMKTRGLTKSLHFLHNMHNVIIRKVQLTLEKIGQDDETEFNADVFDYDFESSPMTIDQEQEDELRRYGVWSPEAIALQLPSYVPTFLFLSVIPLEIMHEYLRLRIESRPKMPNPLSLEQLMKEVREGLILAMTHRERFHKHINTALEDNEKSLTKYVKILNEFDSTVRQVLAIYLDYVEQWVVEATPIDQQKAALSTEWSFTKLMAPMIYGEHATASLKFCKIIGQLLQNISKRLLNGVKKVNDQVKVHSINDDLDKSMKLMICRDMQSMFIAERENAMRLLHFSKSFCRDLEQKDFHRDHQPDTDDELSESDEPVAVEVCTEVKTAVTQLQREVLAVRHTLTKVIEKMQITCQDGITGEMDDQETIRTRSREILHQSFKFGFDYHKELGRLFETKIVTCRDNSCEFNLSLGIIEFAKMWMQFVTKMCELGRGVRPRWAAQGLDYLISACDPANTKHLTETEFNDLKAQMDACISHVVGIVSEPEKPVRKRTSPRMKKEFGKPLSPRVIGEEQKMYYHQLSVREESVSSSSAPNSPQMMRKQMSVNETESTTLKVPKTNSHSLALRRVRIRDSVNQLDLHLDQRWRNHNLIGQVKELSNNDKIQIRSRSVHFSWHRGIKIGQGRFGKVYTAVNNSTGELMAMKEIPIQPNETRAIRNVAEELKIFEGISHKFLVKYHGVEVHREELLIFMELCAEGTLESLVEVSGPLHEGLTRRFTAQLLTAVRELHKHGVVHRDIKTANIFLTNGGNSLKLGDFGSAVKIQAHTTVPGELKGYVGTQAYMAPEVFTKTNTDGHGRASDIWSSGCVTIEMASGKRPWAQFDSNFQIMFKVGMGETPEVPNALSTEGHAFLQHCLEHDPTERWNAAQLLEHHFCKVDMECEPCLTPAEGRRNHRKMSLQRK